MTFCNRFSILLLFCAASFFTYAQQPKAARVKTKTMEHQALTYLALGDSYTIGEAVSLRQSFPYQTVALLREKGKQVAAPEILATTGWTTDELAAAIKGQRFLPSYNLVSLLIGVNNQYRGRSLEEYKSEFTGLLAQALLFAGNKRDRVVVLSIPDYGVTPFAKNRNPQKIGTEIDAFNAAAAELAAAAGVHFVDITTDFQAATNDADLVASDGLHPSAKAYDGWAQKLATIFASVL